jgi:hypothetical protein
MLCRSAPLGCLQLGIVALALAGTMRCPVMPPGTMRRITAMSRHRDHLHGLASSLHFYGMPEAPARPLRDRGLSGRDRLTGREQLVKAAAQLAQAEFDREDLAALVRRPMPVREPAELAISISGCPARNAWSRGTWSWLGGGTMLITAQYLATAVIGVKGTSVTSLTGVQQVPRLPASDHPDLGAASATDDPNATSPIGWHRIVLSRYSQGAGPRTAPPTRRGGRLAYSGSWSCGPACPGRRGRCRAATRLGFALSIVPR